MTKQIPLTKGQFALVDDEDFERLNQQKWQAKFNPTTNSYYAVSGQYDGGGRKGQRTKHIKMSRFIMNTPQGLDCDHINHNTLDNRRKNLRNVTRSQNLMNKQFVKGIQEHGKGFRARITINRQNIYSPTRKTLEEAIQDRRKLESIYFGEFSPK